MISLESKSVRITSAEASYLKYLIRIAIPSRLVRIYSFEAAAQILILALSISAVFAGYLSSRLKR
jgi:maltodextrin utilization protein YvdJ